MQCQVAYAISIFIRTRERPQPQKNYYNGVSPFGPQGTKRLQLRIDESRNSQLAGGAVDTTFSYSYIANLCGLSAYICHARETSISKARAPTAIY